MDNDNDVKDLVYPEFAKLDNPPERKRMPLTLAEVKAKLKEMVKFMNDNPEVFNPHSKIIVDCTSAEILSGEVCVSTAEFVRD